jgi:YVTN family beta-propeller protein
MATDQDLRRRLLKRISTRQKNINAYVQKLHRAREWRANISIIGSGVAAALTVGPAVSGDGMTETVARGLSWASDENVYRWLCFAAFVINTVAAVFTVLNKAKDPTENMKMAEAGGAALENLRTDFEFGRKTLQAAVEEYSQILTKTMFIQEELDGDGLKPPRRGGKEDRFGFAPPGRRAGIIVPALSVVFGLTVAVVLLVGLGRGVAQASTVEPHESHPADSSASQPIQHPVAASRGLSIVPSVPVPSLDTPVPVGPTPEFVALSPDGRLAYVANAAARTVTAVDTSVNKAIATIPVDAGPPQFLTFSPDGRRAYVSIFNDQRTIHLVAVIDTTTDGIVATIPMRTRPFRAALSADVRLLYVPNHDSATVSIVDTATNTVIKEVAVPRNPHWIELSRDGTRAYLANHESNVVSVLDTASDTILAEIPVGTSPHALAVHPTRPLVANVNYDSDTVTVIDTNANQVIATIPVGKQPQSIEWAPDGRFAYVVNDGDSTLSVIDASSFRVTATLPTGGSPTSVAVLPTGRQAYVSDLDAGTLTVLDTGR